MSESVPVDDVDDGEAAEVERLLVERAARGETLTLPVVSIPRLERQLACAVPLFCVRDDLPDFPCVVGTAFWVALRGRRFLITAAHNVVKHLVNPDTTELFITDRNDEELHFGPGGGLVQLTSIKHLNAVALEAADDNDIAIAECVNAESARLTWLELDPSNAWREAVAGTPFVVAGFPCDERTEIDYEAKRIHRTAFLAFGHYRGPLSATSALHMLQADSTLVSDDKAPHGLSGSPVFQLGFDLAQGRFTLWFAGTVIQANRDMMRFIAAERIVAVLEGSLSAP